MILTWVSVAVIMGSFLKPVYSTIQPPAWAFLIVVNHHNDRRGKLPNRVSIDARPEIVDQRERLGDWEIDTIIAKGQQNGLLSLTERKSRLALLRKIGRRTARPSSWPASICWTLWMDLSTQSQPIMARNLLTMNSSLNTCKPISTSPIHIQPGNEGPTKT